MPGVHREHVVACFIEVVHSLEIEGGFTCQAAQGQSSPLTLRAPAHNALMHDATFACAADVEIGDLINDSWIIKPFSGIHVPTARTAGRRKEQLACLLVGSVINLYFSRGQGFPPHGHTAYFAVVPQYGLHAHSLYIVLVTSPTPAQVYDVHANARAVHLFSAQSKRKGMKSNPT